MGFKHMLVGKEPATEVTCMDIVLSVHVHVHPYVVPAGIYLIANKTYIF